MKKPGLRGAVRGKAKRTAAAGKDAGLAEDLVKRESGAPEPDKLWVADFTYASTRTGWCYTAFIADVFARRIAGCSVSARMDRDMVPAAFKMAAHTGERAERGGILPI